MHNKIGWVIILGFLLAGCSSDNIDLTDPLSSGRGFIEANLKGDYVKAAAYMVKDSTNDQLINGLRDSNSKMSADERERYREADIIIDSTKSIDDSTDIIYYKNSFKKEPTKLRLTRHGDEWRVDFKYTFWDNP